MWKLQNKSRDQYGVGVFCHLCAKANVHHHTFIITLKHWWGSKWIILYREWKDGHLRGCLVYFINSVWLYLVTSEHYIRVSHFWILLSQENCELWICFLVSKKLEINFKTNTLVNKSKWHKLLGYFVIYPLLNCSCKPLLCLFHSSYPLIIPLSAWIWIKSESVLKEIKIKIFLKKQIQD